MDMLKADQPVLSGEWNNVEVELINDKVPCPMRREHAYLSEAIRCLCIACGRVRVGC